MLRNCQILSVFQSSFTSNSCRIRIWKDFSRIRILLKFSYPSGSTQHCFSPFQFFSFGPTNYSITHASSFQSETGEGEGKMKAIAASSIKLPSMGAWDIPNSKSPALYAPPDMNSKWRSTLLSTAPKLTCLPKSS